MRRGYSTGVSDPGVLDSGCRVADRAQADRERGLSGTSTMRRSFATSAIILTVVWAAERDGRTLWVGGQHWARSPIVAHHQESDSYENLVAVVFALFAVVLLAMC